MMSPRKMSSKEPSRPRTHWKEDARVMAAASKTTLRVKLTFVNAGLLWTWVTLNSDESGGKVLLLPTAKHTKIGLCGNWPHPSARPEPYTKTFTNAGYSSGRFSEHLLLSAESRKRSHGFACQQLGIQSTAKQGEFHPSTLTNELRFSTTA